MLCKRPFSPLVTVQTMSDEVLQSQFDGYLTYLGGAAGALVVTGAAAYWASRPAPERPLFPLDAQAILLPVRKLSSRREPRERIVDESGRRTRTRARGRPLRPRERGARTSVAFRGFSCNPDNISPRAKSHPLASLSSVASISPAMSPCVRARARYLAKCLRVSR